MVRSKWIRPTQYVEQGNSLMRLGYLWRVAAATAADNGGGKKAVGRVLLAKAGGLKSLAMERVQVRMRERE